MRWFALVVVAGLFVVHHGGGLVVQMWPQFNLSDAHYLLQGLGGALLAVCLLLAVWTAPRSYWRDLTLAALVFWILEQVEIVGCRAAVFDLAAAIAAAPPGMGYCTYVTGIPFGRALTWVEGLFVVVALGTGIASYLWRWYED